MILDEYQILYDIGQGRYSRIYKAKNLKNNQIVAIKKIWKNYFDEPDYDLKCANRELKITLDCQNENVIKFYKSHENKYDIFLIMEYCDMTLSDYIEKEGPFKNLYFFQQFFMKFNNALKVINQKKVIHRDIKPDNIFIRLENGQYIPKLADFGISRYYSEKLDYNIPYENDHERYSGSIGTYHYIAPEILKEEPYNHKCDLYSLGVTLYISLYGHVPYKKMSQILLQEKISIKTGVESLDNLIDRLLEFGPNKRISFEEYFDHKFFKENKNFLQNYENMAIKPKKKQINNNINSEDMEKMNKVKDIAKSFIDIMEIPNYYINNNLPNKNQKISNIIYYDENIEKHLEDIHNDSDVFENATNGAFLLCTNLNSLNFTMIDIKERYEKDHRINFNLIVTGSQFEKVMNHLILSKSDKYISYICIYCMKINKYSHYMKKYNKIKGIYNSQKNVINFINQYSNQNIHFFPYIKFLSFHVFP